MTFGIGGATGLVGSRRFITALESLIGQQRVESCTAARLSIAVTNLTARRVEVLDHGPLARLIAASCAVPVLFDAVALGGDYYWDGGIAASAPLHALIDDEAIRTIIVHCVSRSPYANGRGERLSVGDAVGLSHEIISDHMLRELHDEAARRGKTVLMVNTPAPNPSLWRRSRKLACMRAGRASAASVRIGLPSVEDPPCDREQANRDEGINGEAERGGPSEAGEAVI